MRTGLAKIFFTSDRTIKNGWIIGIWAAATFVHIVLYIYQQMYFEDDMPIEGHSSRLGRYLFDGNMLLYFASIVISILGIVFGLLQKGKPILNRLKPVFVVAICYFGQSLIFYIVSLLSNGG
ncbi:MAG: hypothetical protein IJI74_04995 [Firmicutes bacterium]|nr:hypothetical protein [Bacillota bacterium]